MITRTGTRLKEWGLLPRLLVTVSSKPQNTPLRNMPPIARFERATWALEEFVAVQKSNNFNNLQRKNGAV